MAEQSPRDVVNQAQSVGNPAPTDVSADNTTDLAATAAVAAIPSLTKFETPLESTTQDTTVVEDDQGTLDNSGNDTSLTPESLVSW